MQIYTILIVIVLWCIQLFNLVNMVIWMGYNPSMVVIVQKPLNTMHKTTISTPTIIMVIKESGIWAKKSAFFLSKCFVISVQMHSRGINKIPSSTQYIVRWLTQRIFTNALENKAELAKKTQYYKKWTFDDAKKATSMQMQQKNSLDVINQCRKRHPNIFFVVVVVAYIFRQ